jgi:pectinesterase
MHVDAVVAADGSGQHTTIQEAINSYNSRNINGGAYAIYIKAGLYEEQVTVPKHAKNVVFVGDGDRTVITGSRSMGLMQPGMTTFKSATLSEFTA